MPWERNNEELNGEEGQLHLAQVGVGLSRENFLLNMTFEQIWNRDCLSILAQECLCDGVESESKLNSRP